MFLLTLCIGFAPLQSVNAGNLDHMESMSANCVNCDVDSGVDPDACDGTQCAVAVGSCGANHISSISQETLWSSMALISPGGHFCSHFSLYQSHLNFSIYRPPIS